MKKYDIYKSIMKYLTDKNISLNAKGFLSVVLFNDDITPQDVQKYCTDDVETIKDVMLELKIMKYIKYDPKTNTLLAGPEPYTEWSKPIMNDLKKRAKNKIDKER